MNGAPAGSANPTARSGSLSNASVPRFGSRSQEFSGLVQLGLDEPTLYNRVLTSSEIQGIYNAGFQYGICGEPWPGACHGQGWRQATRVESGQALHSPSLRNRAWC